MMTSTFTPCVVPSSDPISGNPFLAFDCCGFPPWDSPDLFQSIIDSPQTVTSNSGSAYDSQPVRNKPDPENQEHVHDEPNRPVSVVDEKKRRRMISNRESARRSRMRKQKQLENLRNQVSRLRTENRELNNKLRFILHHFQRVRTDNGRIRSEFSVLQRKLADIRQIMLFRQLQQQFQPTTSTAWPCSAIISEQTPSLIA